MENQQNKNVLCYQKTNVLGQDNVLLHSLLSFYLLFSQYLVAESGRLPASNIGDFN